MHKVLITGITGFLGSHIAENLISKGIIVIGLKRENSDLWRCNDFKNQIEWINIDEKGDYKNQLMKLPFDTIVHGAWIGVEASERDNWSEQIKNLAFLVEMLEVSKAKKINKFIFLGSQAEYGLISGKVSEIQEAKALNAYSSVKLACLQILRTYCVANSINWIWLRIFSLYGEKENDNWLIPSLIRSMTNQSHMDFSPGEQRYAYMYVKDFAHIINKMVTKPVESGIYNISSNQTITIRFLIEAIKNMVRPDFQLNFGALNYREHQSMHMEGDMAKTFSQIGEVEFTDFNVALRNTLNYYIKN